MLNFIPISWMTSISRTGFNPAYNEEGRKPGFQVLLCEIPLGLHPYQFGFKTRAGRRNFLGNRNVGHVQLHGAITDLPGASYPTDDDLSFRWQFPDGKIYNIGGTVSNVDGDSYLYDKVGTFTSGRKEFHERVLNLVEHHRRVWIKISLNILLDGFWEPAHYNASYTIEYLTPFWRGKPSSDLEYAFKTVSSYSVIDVDSAEVFLDGLLQGAIASMDHLEPYSGFGYASKLWRYPEREDKLFLKSSSLRKLKYALRSYATRVEPEITFLAELEGEATQEAADRVRYFDGNTAVYLKELFELKDAILDLVRLLKGDVSLKSLADLWVSSQYGLKLTALDTIDLAGAAARKLKSSPWDLFSVSRGSAFRDNVTCHVKMYYDPTTRNGFASVMANLFEWDLFPSLQNVWDIVPYSFVVDWFVDVEGFLTAIDTRTYLSVLNVFSTLYSVKYGWGVNLPQQLGLLGRVQASRFTRFSTKEPIEPVPTFSGDLPSFKNVITGGALIIQRR